MGYVKKSSSTPGHRGFLLLLQKILGPYQKWYSGLPNGCRGMPFDSNATYDLEPDPDAIARVATTFVLAPTVVLCFFVAPTPVVGINANAELRSIFVPHFDMPAIAFAIAIISPKLWWR